MYIHKNEKKKKKFLEYEGRGEKGITTYIGN